MKKMKKSMIPIKFITINLLAFFAKCFAFVPQAQPQFAATSSYYSSDHGGVRELSRTAMSSQLSMMDPSSLTDIATKLSFNSVLLAETEAWVQPAALVLDPFLNFMSLAMLIRVVLSWYPTTNVKELPWIVVVLPTQPLLKSIQNVVPPAFGVDITPIVWLGIFTFIHEILLGQQGLLTLKLKYGI